VARVQHQRDAGGGEVAALARHLGGELLRHLPEHFREVHARLLEDAPLRQHARPPAAAALALPGVLAETAAAVQLLQAGADAVLQLAKVIGGAGCQIGGHGNRGPRSPGSPISPLSIPTPVALGSDFARPYNAAP